MTAPERDPMDDAAYNYDREQQRDDLKALVTRQAGEIERLKKLVYVPGLWRCVKCKFQLMQANLNAGDGTVTARNEPGDKCPNCDTPLWPVTERQAGNDMVDRCEEQALRATAAESRLAAMRAALEHIKSVVGTSTEAWLIATKALSAPAPFDYRALAIEALDIIAYSQSFGANNLVLHKMILAVNDKARAAGLLKGGG